MEFGDEIRDIRVFHRPCKQITLHCMHSGGFDEFLLFNGFDTFGNNLKSQSAAYAHDCMDNCRINR